MISPVMDSANITFLNRSEVWPKIFRKIFVLNSWVFLGMWSLSYIIHLHLQRNIGALLFSPYDSYQGVFQFLMVCFSISQCAPNGNLKSHMTAGDARISDLRGPVLPDVSRPLSWAALSLTRSLYLLSAFAQRCIFNYDFLGSFLLSSSPMTGGSEALEWPLWWGSERMRWRSGRREKEWQASPNSSLSLKWQKYLKCWIYILMTILTFFPPGG